MSGVSDVIKHMRLETKLGLEQVSPMRRALGPSHASCLMSSPSHLIYGAKRIFKSNRMPERVLLIHGGADTDVPIVSLGLVAPYTSVMMSDHPGPGADSNRFA